MDIRVRVTPKARKETVAVVRENVLSIAVREPNTENRANGRVRELLAERYRVPIEKVRIMSGHQKPSKLIQIT